MESRKCGESSPDQCILVGVSWPSSYLHALACIGRCLADDRIVRKRPTKLIMPKPPELEWFLAYTRNQVEKGPAPCSAGRLG